ncbi:MAG: hypothetical protein QGH33_16540 [Pirellulaceae bacterium]|jgi:hypothetical protein|nr:hypothetical protein [Pirellulaceae bacterium]MDP7304262.1 hypothetical protein [Pirellulaceae bacterium]
MQYPNAKNVRKLAIVEIGGEANLGASLFEAFSYRAGVMKTRWMGPGIVLEQKG